MCIWQKHALEVPLLLVRWSAKVYGKDCTDSLHDMGATECLAIKPNSPSKPFQEELLSKLAFADQAPCRKHV